MEGLVSAMLAIAGAIALLAFVRYQKTTKHKAIKLPPSPPTIPIIGNLHQIAKGGDVLHVALAKLSQVYGRLITVWFGSRQPMVIVSDHELAWEVLVSKSPDFASRQFPSLSSLVLADFRTIVSSNAGPHWHGLRRGLQNTGLGPLSVTSQYPLQESDMSRMVNDMLEEAKANNGVVKPYPHIRRNTVRLLARLIFGPDFSDAEFEHGMDELVEDGMSYSDTARLVDAFPQTRFVPSVKRTIARTYELKRRISKFIGRYLEASPPPPNTYGHFLLTQNYPEDVVIFSIFEVFALGVDSTGSTTMWALALLVHNREAQEKLHSEIQEKATKNEKGVIKVEELSKLPYLQAVIKETMRMKPIAPLAVPHKVARDTVLGGTELREGTTVMVNLYAMHYDPKVWEKPEQFIPERFLENGRKMVQMPGKKGVAEQYSFLPFGAGMRVCAGMEIGKLQLAFSVANLVNALQWSSAVEGVLPDLTEDFTFVLAMKKPLEAKIKVRA